MRRQVSVISSGLVRKSCAPRLSARLRAAVVVSAVRTRTGWESTSNPSTSSRDGSARVHDVPSDGVLRVQPAGSRDRETIALHHIVSIDYGYATYPEYHGGGRR